MKKAFLYLVILVSFLQSAKAQEIVLDFSHENGKYFNIRNIVETTDSCMIVECPMFEAVVVGPDLGDMFYKVTMDGQLVDSLFIENENINLRTLLVRDPQNPDNYLYAYFDMTQEDVLLRMVYFDRDFNIQSTKEIVFGYSGIRSYDYFMDPNGDIIASFSVGRDSLFTTCFNRIGFDGELKYSREVPEIRHFQHLQSWHTWVFRQSPLQYSYWGSENGTDLHDRPPIRLYVLDSLFNVTDEHCHYLYDGQVFKKGWQEHIVPLDDEHYLLAIRYNRWEYHEQLHHRMVFLGKYDRNHELDQAGLFGESTTSFVNPICAEAVNDTLIYYSYMTMCDSGDISSELTLLCLDNNLNLNWERHFTYPRNHLYWGIPMKIMENGNVAIGSFRYGENPGCISVVVIRNDGTTGTPEMEPFIRPFTYYPVPVHGELCLRFSPDVQPKQIELYDLQGRLVSTQRSSFESIDMSQLPAGTYTMRVALEDGKVYADKVVKE